MKFISLYLSCSSASFELQNHAIYESPEAYDVKINGKSALKNAKRNVFSLFDLAPDTDYVIAIGEDQVKIHTLPVSLTLHMKDIVPAQTGDDTLRIQMAIAALPENGRLVFDAGEYHASCIFLKSNLTIQIDKGATIYGDPEVKDYPLLPGEAPYEKGDKPLQLISWEGGPKIGMTSLFTAYHCHNVAIVGEGLVDGQAQKGQFWVDVKHLTYSRPRLFYFDDCDGVTLQGVTVQNSPSWTIHPYFSKHVNFYDFAIINPKDAPNTDGIDPECCDEVNVIGIRFSVGDDCIAIKSGKIYIGKTYKTPSDHVTIRNCYMHEGHGAVVLGSEAGAGLKHLDVERCLFEGTDRGLRVKSRRGRGVDCVMDGIHFKDIRMKHVLTPLAMSMFYFCDPDGKDAWVQDKHPAPVDEKTPYLGSFVFENLECTDAEIALGFFYGLPEQPIASITIKNSSFSVKADAKKGYPSMMSDIEMTSKMGFYFANVKSVTLDHVKAEGYVGEKTILNHVGSFIET